MNKTPNIVCDFTKPDKERIKKLEEKLRVAVEALKRISQSSCIGSCDADAIVALKQIEELKEK